MSKNSVDPPACSLPSDAPRGQDTPRGQARRRAFLDCARELFAEKGFAGTSLNEVVERAGGSKATLYDLFGSKEGLLIAAYAEKCAQFWEEVELISGKNRTPQDFLTTLACTFVGKLTSPDGLSFIRILTAEGYRVPEIVEHFFASGPNSLHAHLSHYFRQQQALGILGEGDTLLWARLFLAMVKGDWVLAEQVGYRWVDEQGHPMTAARLHATLEQATALFLRGIQR